MYKIITPLLAKLLAFLFFVHFQVVSNAASGLFEIGVIIDGTTYGTNFNGTSFSVPSGGALNLTEGSTKTYKNGTSDVCSARLQYSIYPVGGSPSFMAINLPFNANLPSSGDQLWKNTSVSVNLAAGLAPGNYKIAIYSDATVSNSNTGGCPSSYSQYYSNSGANFVANLTITAVLPVELVSLSGISTSNKITLNWETASEINNDRFVIEHSTDGNKFDAIGELKGKENAQTRSSYVFTDNKPADGVNYYRLKDVSFSGNASYSKAIAVQFGKERSVSLAPNPTHGDLNLSIISESDESLEVQILDQLGRVVLTDARSVPQGENVLVLDLTLLRSGVYIVRVGDTSKRLVKL
jgi:hypothetical protein